MIIEVNDISVEIVKKPNKNIYLRVYPPHGTVKICVPQRLSERSIRKHIQEKYEWIRHQQERIKNNPTHKEHVFQDGSLIPFKGKNYLLIIKEQQHVPYIEIKDELIYCYSISSQIQSTIERWYYDEMAALLPDLIRRWEIVIGVQIIEFGIKKMKTRWGSCNTQAKRIWLNLNLIKKPLICLEYVLVHELVHLLEASHNHRFHALMTQFMPEWKKYKNILESFNHAT